MSKRIAIIGAGMAGTAAAARLRAAEQQVVLFDKGRGVGGRMSARRTDDALFNHGASYICARTLNFERQVERWRQAGVIREAEAARFAQQNGILKPVQPDSLSRPVYVGVPGMNEPLRWLSSDGEIRTERRIDSLIPKDDGWHLQSVGGIDEGMYDAVIVATPAPQAAVLLEAHTYIADFANQIAMAPLWVTMLSFEEKPGVAFDSILFENGPLSMAYCATDIKGIPDQRHWVIRASESWSMEHVEASSEDVMAELLRAFCTCDPAFAGRPTSYATVHRWRFAFCCEPREEASMFDERKMIAVCGDWFQHPDMLEKGATDPIAYRTGGIERAFLSGTDAAERLLMGIGAFTE
ncbi:MAG: NAD(P)/FAD-dependent oxidoreductase [Phycisphaerae bacterium]